MHWTKYCIFEPWGNKKEVTTAISEKQATQYRVEHTSTSGDWFECSEHTQKSQTSSPAVKTATKVSVYYSLSDHNEAATLKSLPLLLCLIKGPQQLLRNRALTLPHQISFQTMEKQITLSLQSHIKTGPISKWTLPQTTFCLITLMVKGKQLSTYQYLTCFYKPILEQYWLRNQARLILSYSSGLPKGFCITLWEQQGVYNLLHFLGTEGKYHLNNRNSHKPATKYLQIKTSVRVETRLLKDAYQICDTVKWKQWS